MTCDDEAASEIERRSVGARLDLGKIWREESQNGMNLLDSNTRDLQKFKPVKLPLVFLPKVQIKPGCISPQYIRLKTSFLPWTAFKTH